MPSSASTGTGAELAPRAKSIAERPSAGRGVLVECGFRRVIFDAPRKIRRALVAKGYLEEPGWSGDE
jgi:hypothetical protein